MQPAANVLDFVVAFITISIQYPHIDVIMSWYTLCVRACVVTCVRACMRACMHECMQCKTSCQRFVEIDLSRITVKVKCCVLVYSHEYM